MPDALVRPASRRHDLNAAARGAAISSAGMALPSERQTNAPIARRLGVSERWIVERTGVLERRVASADERLHDFAARAALAALEGADAMEIDLVLVATMSNEDLTPAAAPLVAAAIGAERAGAIDVNAACTGFLSALALGTAQIEAGRADRVLVIGADLLSRLTDPEDRSTAALFGDGAGAVLLEAHGEVGRIGPFIFGADGARSGLIQASRAEGLIRMKGPDTFRQAVDRLSEVTLDCLDAAGGLLEDVDLFVYHQANSRIVSAVGERLGLPAERVIDIVPRYGNTSAASIPIALSEAAGTGMLPDGALVLLAAFGGGLTWGGTVIEWGAGDAA
jgi:3-oxoacyl-[acyl-carrier-protein] synthase III